MLLDERPLVLLPSLAQAVGAATGAIALQQLHFHLANPDNGRIHGGEQWIFKTYEDWQKDDFPFWSTDQIQRIFSALEKKGLIVSCQPEGRNTRRKYYRINYGALEKAMSSAPRARARARAQDHARSRHRSREIASSSLSETTRAETTSTSTHHRAVMKCDFNLSDYLPEEREVIDLYHDLLCGNGQHWKRVEKCTQGVSDALTEAGEAAEQIIRLAANGDSRVAIPKTKKQRTLVRLLWENWQNCDLPDDP